MFNSKYKKLIKQKKIKPITCLSIYSKSIAKIIDGKVDIVLVGDSLATTLYDMKNTQSVTLQMMKDHGKAVVKNINHSLTIVDMPYRSYDTKFKSLKNAKEIIKYTKADLVKLETNHKNIDIVKFLNDNNIKVAGHIGVTPQKFKNFNKIKSVGASEKEINYLISLALKLESAGAKLIVLECIKEKAAKKITNIIKIPTIGIGSSKNCDGQVLVINDMLNIDPAPKNPKFVKNYSNLKKIIAKAVNKFTIDVRKRRFPSKKNTYY